MKLREAISRGRDRLAAADLQCADPFLHMKQIAGHCFGVDMASLYVRWEDELTSEEEASLEAFLVRRCAGEPFQYIAGYEWFWEDRFEVGPGVLIPRRETEILVETLLSEESRDRVQVAELGAGSGNIGVSILRERPRWSWLAFERHAESLPYTLRNRVALLPVDAGYELIAGDFFEKAPERAPYDWVVANAPYVTSGELPRLAKEVLHEPAEALDGGKDGMDVLRRLIASAPRLLKKGGGIAGEMAEEQGVHVSRALEDSGFREVRVIRDYSGKERIFLGQWGHN